MKVLVFLQTFQNEWEKDINTYIEILFKKIHLNSNYDFLILISENLNGETPLMFQALTISNQGIFIIL